MARIEFKNATVRLLDGHSNSGAVNDTPANGDTSLVVSGITGIIPVSCRFTFAGVDKVYTITSTVETGSDTTTINFTPALATADTIPGGSAAITFNGRSLSIKVGDGNLQFTENREFIYDLDRGLLDTVREGNQVPLDVSLDFVWEFLTAISGATTPTISDVLHHRGAAAAWESSSDDPCEPFALDIEIEHVPACGSAETELITLPDFRWEALPHSMTDAQVSMTGRCNATEALILRL